jgi:hypothetical protein
MRKDKEIIGNVINFAGITNVKADKNIRKENNGDQMEADWLLLRAVL